jgi:replicative DNA helicase
MYKTFSQKFDKVNIISFMSQDEERFKKYKNYGAYDYIDTLIKICKVEDIKKYFDILKKFSLLREYDRIGFNVEKIIKSSKFDEFKALDIYRMIRAQADRVHTKILTNNEVQVLNNGMQRMVLDFLEKPDKGIEFPFNTMDELFRGIRLGTMMSVGMLSNAGKTRFMFNIIAYVAFICKKKVLVLLNEMSEEDVKKCLLTTVINNKEFQLIHGIKAFKPERQMTLGLYLDDNDCVLTRKQDEHGNFVESKEEYVDRLYECSTDFRNTMEIAKWVDEQTEDLIFVKDVSSDYNDKTLEFEIRKANLTKGIEYIFYDTLKNDLDSIGEWNALKTTVTKLQELAKQLRLFIYGSIQLTDDSINIDAFNLSSMNIANCKQMKHILDGLLLAKEIDKEDFPKYCYISNCEDDEEYGEKTPNDLSEKKRYYIFVVDKNRVGEKKKILFSLDLNTNIWTEEGEVFLKKNYKPKK